MKKNILCLLVLFCLTAVLLTVEVYADDEAVDAVPIEGQSCGDYVYWAFSGNTLRIWGSGDMYDYISEPAPWYNNRNEIRYIEISRGVTSVGAYAFRNLSNLQRVVLPTYYDDVEVYSAETDVLLQNVEGYHTYSISRPFTHLNTGAFANCTSLSEITIPKTVTNAIGAFINCTGLKSISVESDNTTYESRNGVMVNTVEHSLTAYPAGKTSDHYTVPSDIETISGFAAYNCDSLRYIMFPQHLDGIYLEAFYQCSNLKSVYFQSPPPATWIHDIFSHTHPDLTLYYSSEYADSWTSPTWTDPNGVTYNTCMYTPMAGDIDQDGKVTQNDVNLMIAYFSGKDPEIPYFFGADMDGDGIVSRADVMYLARAVDSWDGYTLPEKDVSEEDRYTVEIQFIDSETNEKIPLTELFPPDEWNIEAGEIYNYAHLALENNTFNGGYLQGGFLNDDTMSIINDKIILKNVPAAENYFISFDASFGDYVLRYNYETGNSWSYGYFDIDQDTEISIPLIKSYLIVGDTLVTKDNCNDILGDGTAIFDYSQDILTLTNANITADYVIHSMMEYFTILIPDGTVSTLTIEPVDYRTNAAAIELFGIGNICGGGTLIIDGKMGVNAIYAEGLLQIYGDLIIELPSDNTTGIVVNGDINIGSTTINKTGNEDYGHLITANDIYISNSNISMCSAGSNLIWSHGGGIDIYNSNISLSLTGDTPHYAIFAELGSIEICKKSNISISTPIKNAEKDAQLLTATYGINIAGIGIDTTLSPNVESIVNPAISNENGIICEIYKSYFSDDNFDYSIRCTDGTFPCCIYITPTE
ncbi:MAG: leucine-rich repeat protein [Clostridia bacterium]|nr:leucine-rich repeat protein [Clostridia bacterium]